MAMTQEKWERVQSTIKKIEKLGKEHDELLQELKTSCALQALWPDVFDYPPVRTWFADKHGRDLPMNKSILHWEKACHLWIKNDKEEKSFTLKEAVKAGYPFWKELHDNPRKENCQS